MQRQSARMSTFQQRVMGHSEHELLLLPRPVLSVRVDYGHGRHVRARHGDFTKRSNRHTATRRDRRDMLSFVSILP